MIEPGYPHLNLVSWPFHVTASEKTSEQWVGRPKVERRLKNLVRSASRHPASQLVVVWANFGSGKTHALRYMEYLASKTEDVLAAYVTAPQGLRSFLDLHRAIIDSILSNEPIAGGALVAYARGDLRNALLRLAGGAPDDAELAHSWLRGDKLGKRDLARLGIARPVDNVPAAVDLLGQVIAAIRKSSFKLLILLDEVQELESLGKKLPETLGGMHKVFDQSPDGLTLVMSFTTGAQSTVRAILGDALYDRCSYILDLPPLNEADSVELINGLLEMRAVDSALGPAPFTPEAIAAVVAHLSSDGKEDLTARTVIKAFDHILREAEPDIEEGMYHLIDPQRALDLLEDA